MCVRKGNWKIIVGHHDLPFIFPRVYEEPSTTGGWLIDQGSLRGRLLEMLLTLTDMVVGKEYQTKRFYCQFLFVFWTFAGRISTNADVCLYVCK